MLFQQRVIIGDDTDPGGKVLSELNHPVEKSIKKSLLIK